MKLIIDIPEETYKTIINTSFVRDVDLTFKQLAKDIVQTNAIFKLIDVVDNVTLIPDNATVGEIFCMLTHKEPICETANYYTIDKNLWNSLYQK